MTISLSLPVGNQSSGCVCAIYTRLHRLGQGRCAERPVAVHSFTHLNMKTDWTTELLINCSTSFGRQWRARSKLLPPVLYLNLNLWFLFFGSPPVSWTLSGEEKTDLQWSTRALKWHRWSLALALMMQHVSSHIWIRSSFSPLLTTFAQCRARTVLTILVSLCTTFAR